MRRVLEAWEGHLHDPRLPRTLGARLEAAGLTLMRREVIPLLNPSLHPNCYSHGLADGDEAAAEDHQHTLASALARQTSTQSTRFW